MCVCVCVCVCAHNFLTIYDPSFYENMIIILSPLLSLFVMILSCHSHIAGKSTGPFCT